MTKESVGFGNILGDARAENDLEMLAAAFYESSDYHALTKTQDYNIVVGRRGTGKSALYIKTAEFFESSSAYRVLRVAPSESDNLLLQSVVLSISDSYALARYITAAAWRVSILIDICKELTNYYKAKKCSDFKCMIEYCERHKVLFQYNTFRRVTEIIKMAAKASSSVEEIPSVIVEVTEVESLSEYVNSILEDVNKIAVVLFDKLDEGLVLKKNSVSVVGGLAVSAGKFSEQKKNIYVCAYVRDNIFRLLSRYDRDFSRNIESCTLRLRWDDESLFIFIANRIRTALGLDTESNLKVWNRFAHRAIKDRDGFKSCLKNTLLRPRDLLSLLNKAYAIASRASRHEIIEDDINKSAFDISETRLNDLVKEYDEVFTGIEILLSHFKGRTPVMSYQEVVDILDSAIVNADYESERSSDFALLNSGGEAFKVLYGIGFVGIRNDSNSLYAFSFDGSPVKDDNVEANTKVCIHPCYWSALGISDGELGDTFYNEIYDDYAAYNSGEAAELRAKLIGGLVSELPSMPLGADGAPRFEDWCLRAVKILFAGKLANPELHPNGNAIQRRDIVATNCSTDGFWGRVISDYSSRQVIFEVKNYQEMSIDEYRQASSYANVGKYGSFVILITRTASEGLSNIEKGWLREIYYKDKVVVFTIPAMLLSRCIGKLRSSHRFDYAEKHFCKLLDTYERNYLSLRHSRS